MLPPPEIALSEIDHNLHMEQELLAMAEEVATEINAEIPPADPTSFIPGPSIRRDLDVPRYRFGSRDLEIRFFSRRHIYSTYPQASSQMEILWKHHVVYGGAIEILEDGQQREGWNVVLVRSPDNSFGRWLIVETRETRFLGLRSYYEPFAVGAQALGLNLACHWDPKTDPVKVTDKLLVRSDLVRMFRVLIS
jgi:hypothetical protein